MNKHTKSLRVYVVTTGCYSDRQTRGIFSTRSRATQYMNNCAKSKVCWNNDFNDIGEYVVDAELAECEYTRWSLGLMLDDGSLEYGISQQQTWGIPHSEVRVAESIPKYNGRGAVRAESHRSEKHALKLAAEKRQEWLRLKKNEVPS